jgi:hypothetical protein
MADRTNEVRYEDVTQLRSRISWGAVLGGVALAIACYMILTLFFAAIGLSLTEAGVRENAIGIGAIVAAVVTMVVALFVGGWVTTQLTAGETQREAVIHGLLCWAVFTAVSFGMIGMGLRAGYNTLLASTMVAQAAGAPNQNWEQMLRNQGVSQAQIDQFKQQANLQNVQAQAADPANQERARETAMWATWGALVGALLAIGAAVGGALAGCGPTFRLFPVAAASRREIIISH